MWKRVENIRYTDNPMNPGEIRYDNFSRRNVTIWYEKKEEVIIFPKSPVFKDYRSWESDIMVPTLKELGFLKISAETVKGEDRLFMRLVSAERSGKVYYWLCW